MELPRFPAAAEHASRRRDDLDADALRIHLLTLGALVRFDGGPDLGLDRLVDAVRRYELGRDQLRAIADSLGRAIVARKVERRFIPRYPLAAAALEALENADLAVAEETAGSFGEMARRDERGRLSAMLVKVVALELPGALHFPRVFGSLPDPDVCRFIAKQTVCRGETFVDQEALEIYDDAFSPTNDEDPS